MKFKSLGQDDIEDLLRHHRDLLTPAAAEEADRYHRLTCPVCLQRGCRKELPGPSLQNGPGGPTMTVPFGDFLPSGHARCLKCGSLFCPDTSIILESTGGVTIPARPSDPHRP